MNYSLNTKNMTLGNIIELARMKRRLTIKEAAKELGFSFQAIWQIENNYQPAAKNTLKVLADFYGLDILLLAELNFLNTSAYRKQQELLRELKYEKSTKAS